MPLFGSLQTMSLPDLLQWLGSSRKTGTLQVENNRVQKWILFEEGQIVGCSSDDPPERLGQFLLSRGKITEDQLRIALAAQEGSGKHLGKLFVEMGALTREELSSHLDAKAEETIYSVFDWEDAVFRFHEQVTDHPNIFPVALKVDDVLLRGMQRLDEIQRIRTVFNDPGIVLRHTTTVPPEQVLDNKMARTLYDTINGERSVAEILLHVHGSEYLVTKFMYELYRNDFLEIAGVKRVDEPHATEGDVGTGPSVELDPSISLPEAPAPQAEPPLVTPVPALAAHGPPAAAGLAAEPAAFSPDPAFVIAGPTAVSAQPEVQEETFSDLGLADASPADDGDDLLDIPDVFIEASDVEAAEESTAYQMDSQLEKARGAMSAGEYEQALVILDQLYREQPNDDSLRRLTAEAETAFIDKAYRHYVPPTRVPVLTRPMESLEAENMSPTEVFLLSRINGTWDVKSIIQIAPLREVEVLLTLKRMRENGVIELREPERRRS